METPFDHIANSYDTTFTFSPTGEKQRQIVHAYLDNFLDNNPEKRILELNCGTGEDALYLAQKGCFVLATDVSPAMIKVTTEKAKQHNAPGKLLTRICAIQDIELLEKEFPPFDLVFSNFGGINCVPPSEIQKLPEKLDKILTPNGHFIGVIMPTFCWWETLYFLAKLKFKKAFRRLSKKGVKANLEGSFVHTWYYSPNQINALLKPLFVKKALLPVGFALPPSYLDPAFAKKRKLLKILFEIEKYCQSMAFLSTYSDHYLIHFQKKQP